MRRVWVTAGLLAATGVPAAVLAWRAASGGLGAEPVETLTHETGEWALRLLLATLAISPLRRLTGWHELARYRRLLGLAAFAYATLHFSVWLAVEHFFDWALIVEDIVERPYVTVGFAAFLLLVPLAVTSTRGWIRRLGRRWRALHRLVYAAAALAVVHFLWLVKADLREPLVYGALFALLLAARLPGARLRARADATS